METNLVKREDIIGSRRIENYVWIVLLTIGGVGFLLAAGSSYFKINLLPFANSIELNFIPQGILMFVYGTGATLVNIYLILIILYIFLNRSPTSKKLLILILIIYILM
jgi:hypothetical protein